MIRFRRRSLPSGVIVVFLFVAGCGGGDNSTSETAESAPASAAIAEESTIDPTTESSVAGSDGAVENFDSAVAEAFRAGLEFAELRSACFEITDLGCFLSSEQQIAAAAEKVATTLEAVSSASVDVGANVDRCKNPVTEVVEQVSSEWALMLERARAEGSGTKRFGEPDWEYHRRKLGSEIDTPGHAIAGVLLQCIDIVKDPSSELVPRFVSFLLSSDFARSAFSYNLLTQYLCVDQPADPGLGECFDTFGLPDDVGFARGNLESAFARVTDESSYAELSLECRDAITESNTRLMSSLDNFNNVAARELVSADTELQSLLTVGVFQIDDQRRGTAPMYPFDEVMALTCAATAAEAA